MPRTKHAVVIVVVVLLALLGLFVAVTVFAPEKTDDLTLPAAVFSSVTTVSAQTVTVLDSGDATEERAALIEKVRLGGGLGSDVREEYLHGASDPAVASVQAPTPAPAFFNTPETASSSTHSGAEPIFSAQTAHAAEVETDSGATTTEAISD